MKSGGNPPICHKNLPCYSTKKDFAMVYMIDLPHTHKKKRLATWFTMLFLLAACFTMLLCSHYSCHAIVLIMAKNNFKKYCMQDNVAPEALI